jgi:hypothetical protein
VVRDERRFERLIADAKDLIGGLQDITRDIASSAMQQQIIGQRIQTMNDIPALEILAEVCKDDYPSLSDAASVRADSLTSHDTIQEGILEWTRNMESDDDDSDTMTIGAMESMTVTELKHRLSSALVRNRQPSQQTPKDDIVAEDGSASSSKKSDINFLISSPTSVVQMQAKQKHQSSGTNGQDTPDSPHDGLTKDENQEHHEIIEGIASASLDSAFSEEVVAVVQWFDVLSSDERNDATYRVYEKASQQQANFFATLYSSAKVPCNDAASDLKNKLQHFEAKGEKPKFRERQDADASSETGWLRRVRPATSKT